MGGEPLGGPAALARAESHHEPAALQEAPTTSALPARSSRLRWLGMGRYNPLSGAFILLGGVWVLSATEAQRTTQEAEIAQAPESPRALSANQATHPDAHGSMKPQTPGEEAKLQGDTRIADHATPKEEASLALDIQPDTARVYIRAAASTEPFKLLSTGSGSAKISQIGRAHV